MSIEYISNQPPFDPVAPVDWRKVIEREGYWRVQVSQNGYIYLSSIYFDTLELATEALELAEELDKKAGRLVI